MDELREIAANVQAFMDDCANRVGEYHRQRFAADMNLFCLERMESPIEDIFSIALHAMCEANDMPTNPGPTWSPEGKLCLGPGIYINPQAKIGNYRVDFVLTQTMFEPEGPPIIIELDGHAFHDKDKRQRSYEKARDRAFVKQGFRVLHYTGSDVVADPFKIAYEVLDMLGLTRIMCSDGYNPADPLGVKDGC